MNNVRDERSVCGPTWHVPSSSSSWMKTDNRDNKQRQIEKCTTNALSCQLYVYCVVILLHREGLIAPYTAVLYFSAIHCPHM
ncbi:hypothetical protein TNCT_424031 [Trichonephila clavata]|uniref:Uncharacterized protein n=1 Tax=Trichonephila clavata TaxID=2740835 RepID=A0A8X6HB23_TRICU|nr:hypothetical protein TNCT_424031 [Trichonephila clavata]